MSVAVTVRTDASQLRQAQEQERAAMRELAGGVEVGNTAPYAQHLRPLGYVVVDETVVADELDQNLPRVLEARGPISPERMVSVLKLSAFRAVRRMQAFTGGLQPPLRAGGAPRPAHLGGWADRTRRMAASFYYRVGFGSPTPVDYEG